jgi:hypothetical protein
MPHLAVTHAVAACRDLLHNVIGSTKQIINGIAMRDLATGEAIGLA